MKDPGNDVETFIAVSLAHRKKTGSCQSLELSPDRCPYVPRNAVN